MKTTTFKNVWSPSHDKSILIGTNKKNQRWFIKVGDRKFSNQLAKLIMKAKGKVTLADGWEPWTGQGVS